MSAINKILPAKVQYPAIGVCGLSCRMCPSYHRETKSRCPGCKTEYRMGAACAMLRCALKHKGVEFCWDCPDSDNCEKFGKHKELSRIHDTSTCYQKLEDNIRFVQKYGTAGFEKEQKERESLLGEMLSDFNEGRSKTKYCIAATVFTVDELKEVLSKARAMSKAIDDLKEKARLMRAILDDLAMNKGYELRLRK